MFDLTLADQYLTEALPMSVAKKYTKQGRENEKRLPDFFKKAYDTMFQGKQRINIGRSKLPQHHMNKAHQEFLQKAQQEFKKVEDLFSKASNGETVVSIKNQSVQNLLDGQITVNTQPQKLKQTTRDVIKKNKIQDPIKTEIFNTVAKYLTVIGDYNIGDILTDHIDIILSRHPYDVAGMSSDRGWSSCKEYEKGCNSHYLDNEVGHILVAYAVLPNQTGDILSNPLKRALVHPVMSDNDTDGFAIIEGNGNRFYNVPGFADLDMMSPIEAFIKSKGFKVFDGYESKPVGQYYNDNFYPDEDEYDDNDTYYQEMINDKISDILSDVFIRNGLNQNEAPYDSIKEKLENYLNDKNYEELEAIDGNASRDTYKYLIDLGFKSKSFVDKLLMLYMDKMESGHFNSAHVPNDLITYFIQSNDTEQLVEFIDHMDLRTSDLKDLFPLILDEIDINHIPYALVNFIIDNMSDDNGVFDLHEDCNELIEKTAIYYAKEKEDYTLLVSYVASTTSPNMNIHVIKNVIKEYPWIDTQRFLDMYFTRFSIYQLSRMRYVNDYISKKINSDGKLFYRLMHFPDMSSQSTDTDERLLKLKPNVTALSINPLYMKMFVNVHQNLTESIKNYIVTRNPQNYNEVRAKFDVWLKFISPIIEPEELVSITKTINKAIAQAENETKEKFIETEVKKYL